MPHLHVLPHGMGSDTHCTGGWVGSGEEKTPCFHRVSKSYSLWPYFVSAPTTMLKPCVTSLRLLNSTDVSEEIPYFLFTLNNALQALFCNYRFSSHQWWYGVITIYNGWSSARTNFLEILTTD